MDAPIMPGDVSFLSQAALWRIHRLRHASTAGSTSMVLSRTGLKMV